MNKPHPNHYSESNKDASSAYQEGRFARQAQKPKTDNPYKPHLHFNVMWQKGWDDEDNLVRDFIKIILPKDDEEGE